MSRDFHNQLYAKAIAIVSSRAHHGINAEAKFIIISSVLRLRETEKRDYWGNLWLIWIQ